MGKVKSKNEEIAFMNDLSTLEKMKKENEKIKAKQIKKEDGFVYLENCIVKYIEWNSKPKGIHNGVLGPGGSSTFTGYALSSEIEIEPNEGVEKIIYKGAHINLKKGDKFGAKILKAEYKNLYCDYDRFGNKNGVYLSRDFKKEEKALKIKTENGIYKS